MTDLNCNRDMLLCPARENARKEIERLRAALSFYANRARYDGGNQIALPDDPHQPNGCPYLWDVTRDGGEIARRAINQP